jgi:hypothetical protein
MELATKFSLANIPAEKLLHFISLPDLEGILGAERFSAVQQQVKSAGMKPTSKNLKSVLANDREFITNLRRSPAGQTAFDKYRQTSQRLLNPAMREKRAQVRSAMAGPRRGIVGCLATKVEPSDYQECVNTYDNPEYQDISIVPYQALRQSAYQKTKNPLLAPAKSATHISQLPHGLRSYIRQHPSEYESYLQERKAELKLLKSVKKNIAREEARPIPKLIVEPVEPAPTKQTKRRKPVSG